MGHYYRERHSVANTTSGNVSGLTGNEPTPGVAAEYEDLTLADLRELATSRGLPYYGTKAELAQRLSEADQEE